MNPRRKTYFLIAGIFVVTVVMPLSCMVLVIWGRTIKYQGVASGPMQLESQLNSKAGGTYGSFWKERLPAQARDIRYLVRLGQLQALFVFRLDERNFLRWAATQRLTLEPIDEAVLVDDLVLGEAGEITSADTCVKVSKGWHYKVMDDGDDQMYGSGLDVVYDSQSGCCYFDDFHI